MAITQLNTEDFKKDIFDFTKHQEWVYEGKLPAIVDFYADWCGPCKQVAPVLEELSKEYEGKLNFYKIDTDAEAELSSAFGIQSIPTFLFIPMNEQPSLQPGALPKHVFKQIIEEHLIGKKEE